MSADLCDVEKLSDALDICRKILKKNPDRIDIAARACRLCWSIGVQLESEDRARETFALGVKLAERMKQRHPEKPDGWYWYAVNHGQVIARSSIFAKIGAAGKITEHARKTLELDPSYDGGGAYVMLGRINQMIPGGSDRTAEEYFLKAIKIAPGRTTPHLYLAELYADQKRYDEARRELKQVLESQKDSDYPVERKLDLPPAQELMDEIADR